MTERDKELAEQAITYALGLNPEEDAYGNPLNRDKFQRDRDARFADLIRADERERIKAANAPEIERINAHLKSLEDAVQAERKHLEAELLQLQHGVAASSDYIQGRWDLIDEFQDVIRARGKA